MAFALLNAGDEEQTIEVDFAALGIKKKIDSMTGAQDGVAKVPGEVRVLFTDGSPRSEMIEVPAIAGTGKTLEQVNEVFAELGLNYVAKGSMDSNSQVSHQNVRAGTMVEKWSVIELSFGSDDDRG